MKVILFTLALLLTAASWSAAANEPLPKDMLLVNAFGKISADWVLPSGHGQDCSLIVDPGGIPWLGCKGRFLESPSHAVVYMADRPFDSLAWLPGGTLLGVSGDQVGVYSIDAAAKSGKSTAHIPFEPLGQYPGKKVTIYPCDGDAVYLVWTDEKESHLVFLRQKNGSWAIKDLFTSKHPITAVGGNGKRTFVAAGRRVIGLLARTDADRHLALDASIVFDNPSGDVTTLSYAEKLGLFYGTAQGTGYIGSRYHMLFLKTPNAKTSLADGSLFVLPASGGVLKISGLNVFLEKDVEMKVAGAPADGSEETRK